jgi:hypothetical protein
MLILVGLDSLFAYFDVIRVFITYEWPVLRTKVRKEIYSLVMVVIFFICGLCFFCTKQGIYVFEMFDHYGCGLPLLYICAC